MEVKLKSEEKPKLEWEKNPPKHEMTWYNAVEYAKSLGDGWRLPTINELKEAYKNNDIEFKYITYWSNYSYLPNDNYAYAYLIEIGFIINILKVFIKNVHCVKELELRNNIENKNSDTKNNNDTGINNG